MRPQYSELQYQCTHRGCNRFFKSIRGRTNHFRTFHAPVLPPSPTRYSDEIEEDTRGTGLDTEMPNDGTNDTTNHSDREQESRGDDNDDRGLNEHFNGLSGDDTDLDAQFYGPGHKFYCNYHPKMNALPCDAHGQFLPPDSHPAPKERNPDDWTPYTDRIQFEVADFLFRRNQMSAGHMDMLFYLWAATLRKYDDNPPFSNHHHLHETIDKTPLGDIRWQNFAIEYTGEIPNIQNPPAWMKQRYEVWYRDPREVVHQLLVNPDFVKEIDLQPYREFTTERDTRQYGDFMSGDWAWQQADIISEDPDTHGSTFVPLILGSDKTTVSVGTGNNEFYPLYLSIGNVRNKVRRAHRDALVLVGFLAIPKTGKEYQSDAAFRRFRRQLFHSSLGFILRSLKHGMEKPEVVLFGDGHYRRVIYGLGPYIADYEEQVLLACIVRGWCARCQAPSKDLDQGGFVPNRTREFDDALLERVLPDVLWDEYGIAGDFVPFTNDFPRADIHLLLAPDLLHQLIKECFKDHLVDWTVTYIRRRYTPQKEASRVLDEIDRRIAVVAPFSGLRRFPQGRGFKQWTGDDSKALMKVYLSAIEEFVPQDMVRTLRAFLEFCYLCRRHVISANDVQDIEDALARFHRYREIFRVGEHAVVGTFSLPRQHAAKHYPELIRQFGAPNSLCSSITECKHIKAVKEPWRRSNRFNALGQMLLTNQCLDKLAASRVDFSQRGMLDGSCLESESRLKTIELAFPGPLVDDTNVNPEVNRETPRRTIQGDHDMCEADNGPVNLAAHIQLARTPQRNRPQDLVGLGAELNIRNLITLVCRFLFEQLYPDDPRDPQLVPAAEYPRFDGRIYTFNSASSRFYAPSDICGIHGMQREYIRSTPNWRNEGPRRDCVFVHTGNNSEDDCIQNFDIARVLAFFSFKFEGVTYPCAAIRWFERTHDAPDENTGMWRVRPACLPNRSPHIAVIHIDTIYRAAHLVPVYGRQPISRDLKPCHTYDAFNLFYVNKYVDHHAFDFAS